MDAVSASYDLWPIIEAILIYAVIPAVAVVALALVRKLAKWLGVEMTDRQSAAVLAATERVSAAMVRKYAPDLRGRLTVPTDHPAVAEAAEYVERRLPETLKKMKLSGDDIRDLISTELAAKLGLNLPPRSAMTREEIIAEMKALHDQLLQLEKEPTS